MAKSSSVYLSPLKKGKAQFVLIGEAKINDYTYKIDEKSDKSDWIYNSLNLGILCGEKHGTIYTELMGGYGCERENVIYVHGKTEDGRDDFDNRFEINWEDRNNETILESIGDLCFLTAGLEKDKFGKVVYKKFLSAYDFINYVKENLTPNTVVNVKGNLKYSIYNGNVQTKKEVNSIVLSKIDSVDKYKANFTQTMLLTRDSVGEVDKEKSILPIYAKVVDYTNGWNGKTEYNGKLIKCNVTYPKTFEYEIDLENKELVNKIISKVFKVKKNVTEITFEGDLIEGGAVVTTTIDDVPDDIKELIAMGIYTEEEAIAKCSVNNGTKKRMVIRRPLIIMKGDEDAKVPVIQKFEDKYKEEELVFDFMTASDEDEEDEDVNNSRESDDDDSASEDSMPSWMKNL